MASLRVLDARLLRGCSAGLSEPTLIIDVGCEGLTTEDPAVEDRIRAGVAALFADEPLLWVTESDWPTAFLAPSTARGDSASQRLGEWIVALTVALQQWCRQPAWQGAVITADPGRVKLAIPWYDEWSVRRLLDSAGGLIAGWWWPTDEKSAADRVDVLRQRLADSRARGLAADSSFRLTHAAFGRGIPIAVRPSFIQLGWGSTALRVDGACTHRTSVMAASRAVDPSVTSLLLASAGVPVPPWQAGSDEEMLISGARAIGWPVSVGLTDHPELPRMSGIADEDALRQALATLGGAGRGPAFIQKQPEGDDHRILVVDGHVVAAVRRDSLTDVTADLHADNRLLAARAARRIGLDIAGVDMITPDITRSWHDVGAAIRAVEPQPGLDLHSRADPRRDVAAEVLDLIVGEQPMRIPTAAITGTNGKSTTALMLHQIWLTAGRRAGVCTTEQVKSGTGVVAVGNLSGEPGAQMLLEDPTVEAAVIEMPRKGLIVFGHPCDEYDVGALLNIQNDHLGIDGIETLDQMAALKAEVLERASQAIVVNADDPLCMAARSRARATRHILVSRSPDTVAAHCSAGGEAVFLGDRDGEDWIMLARCGAQTPVIAVDEIPATMQGLLRVNATNAMFAAAMAHAGGLEAEVIRAGLASFRNSVEHNPGRYNFIEGFPFRVLLDYAHNADGLHELCRAVSQIPVAERRIVCSVLIGNRHVDHLVELAPLLAETFDEVVLSCYEGDLSADYATDGRDPVEAMLATGSAVLRDSGADQVSVFADSAEAIRASLNGAAPGDLVVVLAAPEDALPVIAELRGSR